jgi:sortase A
MLELETHKRKWPRIVVTIIAVVLFAGGVYMLITIFAPTLPVLSGKNPEETAKRLESKAGTYGNHLYIPKINVDVDIISGGDASALEHGAWHRKPENGDPVKGGNFVLSAHRFVMDYTPQGTAKKSPFYNIDKLAIGDSIFVDYQDKRYEYKITEKYGVKPDNVEVESPTNKPQLTLYSCTLQGSSDGRDVIEAEPVVKN